MKIEKIRFADIKEWLLKKHYSKAIPPISYSFGLYNREKLIGVISYGIPFSPTLKSGIAGDEWAKNVVELNRLVINDDAPKNSASILVGRSLKKLPQPLIIVSFADINMGHVGYVYQATNFIYTGLSAKRTNWQIEGEDKHSFTISDRARGQEKRANYLKEKYGDKFKLVERSRKHRYIYICANKKTKAAIISKIKYPLLPYPKGKTIRYDASYQPSTQNNFFHLLTNQDKIV